MWCIVGLVSIINWVIYDYFTSVGLLYLHLHGGY